MHIIIHLIILFIFVFTLLMINIPQLEHNNYIMTKLYIFVGIFIFEFIVNVIVSLFKRCIINIGRIAKESMLTALIAVVGYSIYTDLEWTNNPIIERYDSQRVQKLLITIIIVSFVAFGYFVEMLFGSTVPGINDCLNNIYSTK